MPTPCVALLRGINVGGKNLVSMAKLREELEAAGYADVRTYIQSGNVVLASDLAPAALEGELEVVLAERLGVPVMVVCLDLDELARVVEDAPRGFGDEPDAHKYDVMFLKRPLGSEEVLDVLDLRDGVDRAWAGDHGEVQVVYFSRDASQLTKSRMNKVTAKPEYQRMTVRNWRTTTKLLAMLRET